MSAMLLLGVLAAVWLFSGANGTSTPGVQVLRTGRSTWVIAAASRLGAVVGGTPDQLGAVAAVACGPMFSREGPRFALYDPSRHTSNPSREPHHGALIAVVGGRARRLGGTTIPPDASAAVQGYPSLVEASRGTTAHGDERTRRLALAVLSGGAQVALVGFTGTMPDFVAELLHGGAEDAVYLDGGRAAYLAVGQESVFRYDDHERPASWVVLA